MAQELLTTFENELTQVALAPADGGTFTIQLDEEVIWDRKRDGGFPEIKQLKQLVRDHVACDRDLGHIDQAETEHRMNRTDRKIGSLECVIIDGGQSPTIPVVLCHGFGAPGDDLVPIGEYLLQMLGPLAEHFQIVFPQAPISLADEGMPSGRAWWRLNMQRLMEFFEANDFSELRTEVPPGIDEARDLLVEVIEEVAASIEGRKALVIGGFSQGAMLTMDVALRGLPEPPTALIQYSGTLICESIWTEKSNRLAGTEVVQSHGRSDFILPFLAAEWLSSVLKGAAASFEFVPFNGPHTIPMEALEATAKLLGRIAEKR